MATQTITDIIILSRSKVAPEGFSLVGEMNGLCICIKPGPAPTPQFNKPGPTSSPLPYGYASWFVNDFFHFHLSNVSVISFND